MTMVKPDLHSEAGAEARRLAWARALTSERDEEALGQLEGDRPWVVSARGWRTRRALGSRVVLIYRIAFEDASGATAEARLIAIAIDLTDARQRHLNYRTIEQLVRQVEPRIQSEIAVATADWRRSVEQSVRSFASARLARRRAIAAQAANVQRREYQPGLFDRRAERARDQTSEESASAGAAAAHQLDATSLGAIAQRPPQLLLVLTP
jgi:hypothetical protein